MRYAAQLWGSVLGIVAAVGLPLLIAGLLFGDAGLYGVGALYVLLVATAITAYYVSAMRDLDKQQ